MVFIFDCDELTNLYKRDDRKIIWDQFVRMVDMEEIKTIEQVFCELKKFPLAHAEYKRLKSRMCLPSAEQYDESVTDYMNEIEKATPKLIDFMGRMGPCDPSDPWLVAIAAAKGWTVVTHEKKKGNGKSKSIYTACKALGVNCWNLHEFLTELGILKTS